MGKYSTSRTRSKRETDELEKAYRGMTGKKRQSKKKQKSHRKAGIVVICIALIAIVLGVAAGYIYLSDMAMNGVILENVYVAGVDVGGMTQQEAIEAVRIATENTYSKTPMVVTVLESKAEIPTSCVGELNIRGAVRAAYKFGNSGSQSKRQEEQNIAMTTGHVVDITPYLELDSQRIQDILFELGGNYSTTLSQSTYEVTGEAPNQTLVVKLGVPEYGLDLDLLYKQVVDAYNRNIFKTTGTCGILEPAPIDLQAILNSYYVAPVDAYFDAKTYEIVPGADGYGFDLEDAQAKLKHASYGSTVEIPFGKISPTVTAESLKKMLYRDTLAFSGYDRVIDDKNLRTNVELACKAINGLILNPGDLFSFNNAVGEPTAEKGYKPGPTFLGDDNAYAIGGGISQVSSHLYACAVTADLEIVARTGHRFLPAYTFPGGDAAISWGSLDLRFRNNTEYPIRIEALVIDGKATVSLIGTDNKDYHVVMHFETSEDPYAISYKTFRPAEAGDYKDGAYIVEPFTGYHTKVYRCKFIKETHELISKELESESTYQRRDGVICKIDNNAAPDTQPDMPGIGGGVITEDGELPPE